MKKISPFPIFSLSPGGGVGVRGKNTKINIPFLFPFPEGMERYVKSGEGNFRLRRN